MAHDKYYAISVGVALVVLKDSRADKHVWKMPKDVLDILESMFGFDVSLYPFQPVL